MVIRYLPSSDFRKLVLLSVLCFNVLSYWRLVTSTQLYISKVQSFICTFEVVMFGWAADLDHVVAIYAYI